MRSSMKWYRFAILAPFALADCSESIGPTESDRTRPASAADPAAAVSIPSTMLETVEAYNPATDTWSTVASLHRPRSGLAAATANGTIYALGGSGSDYLRPVNEAY
jgi:hypothetical protein